MLRNTPSYTPADLQILHKKLTKSLPTGWKLTTLEMDVSKGKVNYSFKFNNSEEYLCTASFESYPTLLSLIDTINCDAAFCNMHKRYPFLKIEAAALRRNEFYIKLISPVRTKNQDITHKPQLNLTKYYNIETGSFDFITFAKDENLLNLNHNPYSSSVPTEYVIDKDVPAIIPPPFFIKRTNNIKEVEVTVPKMKENYVDLTIDSPKTPKKKEEVIDLTQDSDSSEEQEKSTPSNITTNSATKFSVENFLHTFKLSPNGIISINTKAIWIEITTQDMKTAEKIATSIRRELGENSLNQYGGLIKTTNDVATKTIYTQLTLKAKEDMEKKLQAREKNFTAAANPQPEKTSNILLGR